MAGETRRNLRPPPRVSFQRIEGLKNVAPELRNVLHRMQQNIERATQEARGNEENKQKTVKINVRPPDSGVPGDTGEPRSWPDVNVDHGLGTKPRGWKVVKRAGQTTATQLRDRVQADGGSGSATTTQHNSRTLHLYATGTDGDPVTEFTISVW